MRYVLTALAIACCSLAEAQVIKAIVSCKEGNLPGATVSIPSQKRQVVTDLGGAFTLHAHTLGKVLLKVSYTGYAAKEMELDLSEGTTDLGIISLQPAGGQLGEVIVKGTMAASQARAFSIKQHANAIMEVLAADAIGKLPDRNAAEAVQRVQGVAVARYHGEADQATVRGTPFAWTSTLFNGSRLPSANAMGTRAAVLDAVPSEMIQYVQVAKAITPDMEGDAIGGSINFITRTAPNKRMLNVSAAGGYNNFSKDGTYNASLAYGDRFFNGRLGVMIAAAIWDRQWGTDSYDVTYNTSLTDPVQQRSINTFMMKRYMGKRQTYGTSAGLEYKISKLHKLFARGLLDKFNDIRPVYESYIDFTNKRYQYNYRYSYYETKLNGIELGGEHQMGKKLKMDWSVSDYVSKFFLETPPTNGKKGLPIATFRQKVNGGFGGLSADGKKYLKGDAPDGIGDDPMNIQAHLVNKAETMDASKLTLQQLVITQFNNSEEDKTAQVNGRLELSPKLTLKAGIKYRHKTREGINFASHVYVPNAALGVPDAPALLSLSQLQRTGFPRKGGFMKELGNPYDQYIMDPITKQQLFDLLDTATLRKNGFRDVSPATNASVFYDGYEEVSAGYIMAEFQATEKLKIIGGVRNEYTNLEVNSSKVTTTLNGTTPVTTVTPVTGKNHYNALLPMIHLRYALSDKANIRAAYTRTFVRPNFPDLVPGETVDLTKNPAAITRGNPALKPSFAHNFDLMAEYYFNNIGLVSGGVFYKDIKDVIFSDRAMASENGTAYLVTQPKNLQKASLLGFEAGINKRFNFLKGFWSGFGVEMNYTFIHSEVTVPRVVSGKTEVTKSTLPNQSKNLFNAILYYERNGVMVRLAGNYRGKSVETISQQLGPDLYTWTAKNFTLDASASVAVHRNIRLFLELNNLTNEPLKTYLGVPSRPSMVEWYSQRGQMGVRWDIIK